MAIYAKNRTPISSAIIISYILPVKQTIFAFFKNHFCSNATRTFDTIFLSTLTFFTIFSSSSPWYFNKTISSAFLKVILLRSSSLRIFSISLILILIKPSLSILLLTLLSSVLLLTDLIYIVCPNAVLY